MEYISKFSKSINQILHFIVYYNSGIVNYAQEHEEH